MLNIDPCDKRKLVEPLYRVTWRFWVLLLVLVGIIAWALYMYIRQLVNGLGMTGMNRPVYWGLYMVNFIFFIGISHAGTLISAILRVTGAEWRRPITRIAEAITAFALMVGTLQIIIDMGRPDRLLYTILHGRLQSPILWDIVSVTAYFTGSVTYLFLPIIPDAAVLRDNFPADGPKWRKRLYQIVSLGWRGTREQWVRLERAIAVMAVLIIPIAVSVHTIISWILATTVQPGWHSTIFGPYFVVGAIFSGIGALFVAMSVLRKLLGLEEYIKPKQYRNLGLIFITMNAIWFYFTGAEYLTLAAGQQVHEFPVLASKMWGQFAPWFWIMVICMFLAFWILVVPQLLPEKIKKIPVFRPAFAAGATGVVVMAAILLLNSSAFPATTNIDPVLLRRILWTLLLLDAFLAGIGIAAWFKDKLVLATVTASVFVLVGMWLERWNIVVPTLTHPYLVRYATYKPTLTEISLTAGSIALFLLLFLIFFKLFPVISIWEVAEGRVIEKEQEKIRIPLPQPSYDITVNQGEG